MGEDSQKGGQSELNLEINLINTLPKKHWKVPINQKKRPKICIIIRGFFYLKLI